MQREVLQQYPPKPLEEGEVSPLDGMTIFTEGPKDFWPSNIEWLGDAYPTPHFVKEMKAKAAAAASGSGKQ